ncbi:hypothetical protein C2G38_1530051 [Gigaspora rosea]|uniref:Uncharacterized protein n=1 Tax=Gigaspora rosea TaxID=44941 RepID=A0A397V2M8_9GLOM|nr:hypothetical protein C2G38_1530051 [Gigaspora rosea]
MIDNSTQAYVGECNKNGINMDKDDLTNAIADSSSNKLVFDRGKLIECDDGGASYEKGMPKGRKLLLEYKYDDENRLVYDREKLVTPHNGNIAEKQNELKIYIPLMNQHQDLVMKLVKLETTFLMGRLCQWFLEVKDMVEVLAPKYARQKNNESIIRWMESSNVTFDLRCDEVDVKSKLVESGSEIGMTQDEVESPGKETVIVVDNLDKLSMKQI